MPEYDKLHGTAVCNRCENMRIMLRNAWHLDLVPQLFKYTKAVQCDQCIYCDEHFEGNFDNKSLCC